LPCEGRDKKENTGLEQQCRSSGDTIVLEGRLVSAEHDVYTIITPLATVGGGANLNVDEVAEKHGEGDDDEVESNGHRRVNRHGKGSGSSRARGSGDRDRGGISGDDTKGGRRGREGWGRRCRVDLGVRVRDLGVSGELMLDVQLVEGRRGGASSDLRSTSGFAPGALSLRLRAVAIIVEMIAAAVAAGAKLLGPLELDGPRGASDVGDPLAPSPTSPTRLSASRIVACPPLTILVGIGLGGAVILDGTATGSGAVALHVAIPAAPEARLRAVDDGANDRGGVDHGGAVDRPGGDDELGHDVLELHGGDGSAFKVSVGNANDDAESSRVGSTNHINKALKN
jgi:hypothetical protein